MARLPGKTGILNGPLHAAGVIINQYEEPGPGKNTQLLWSMASSTLEIPQDMKFLSVKELRGEIHSNGKFTYKLYGHEATITGMDYPGPSFQVQGELELTTIFDGASIKCQTLSWDSTAETLILRGNVSVTVLPDMLVVCPQLAISNLGSSKNIQTNISHIDPIQKLQQLGRLLVFQGPCQMKLNAPSDVKIDRFLGFSKGHKFVFNVGQMLFLLRSFFTILPDWKATSVEPVLHNFQNVNGSASCSWIGKEICVNTMDGLHIDMEEGRVSFKGRLAVSWAQQDVKVFAGGAEILLKDGTCVLHSQVEAQIQSLKLKASKITWLACQKLCEAEPFISFKCQSQVCALLNDANVSCAHGEQCSSNNIAGKSQDPLCSPPSRGLLRSLIGSTGLVCQLINYSKPRSDFPLELRRVVYSNNRFRKVITTKNRTFFNFLGILQSCLCGFLSSCKISSVSTRFTKSASFFVGIECQLWEFPTEKQKGVDTKRDKAKHFARDEVQFCNSSFAIQKAMEDKAKYCGLFNCRNLIIVEGQ